MNNNTTGAEQVRWDLSLMYSGINDSQIDADVALLTKKAEEFHKQYKGKLATMLGSAIEDYSEIEMLSNRIFGYLSLCKSTDENNAPVKAKMEEVKNSIAQALGNFLTFFELELVALPDTKLKRQYKADPVVARHRPWIEQARVFKPHVLSEPVESALIKRSSYGASAWGSFFSELEVDLSFDVRGQKHSLTEMLHLLTESRLPPERAWLMKLINDGLGGYFAKYSAQTLYMTAGSAAVERRERGYRHPMEVRNKSNKIPDAIVDALHMAVYEKASPLVRRYYRLKAAHLGLETLRWSDRNAPMPFANNATVPFDDGMSTVLTAYGSFSPTLADLVEGFIAGKRIDAPAVKGKGGGAFNASVVLPGGKPVSFTFLNYLGSNRDVMTLAHELGHGVHGILSGEAQGVLMSDAPMAYCETASVFGEMTTFKFLKQRLLAKNDKQGLLALIMGKLDDMMNTVIRQMGFSDFERRIHGMDAAYKNWEEPKKLSVEQLDAVWLEMLKRYYGEEGDVFTYENAEHLWAYVGHFHRPFYVYSYAFGELLTHSLYAQQYRFGEKFEPMYLDLLRAGGTKNAVELLEPFGLDPTDERFWSNGIAISIGAMLEEAEELSKETGVAIPA